MRLLTLSVILFACAALSPAAAGPANAQCATCEVQAAFEKGDYVKAARLARPLADEGNVLAQTMLGGMCEMGDGVRRDYTTAAAWYRKAAEQGFAVAQISLADMYEQGRGVSQDYVQAFKWYVLAVLGYGMFPQDTTNAKANERVHDLAARMTPQQIAEGKDLVREWARQWRAKNGRSD